MQEELATSEQGKKNNPAWQTLLKSVLETEEIEIDCQECYELLDSYAELLLTSAEPAQIMPAVEQHLKQCNCCLHELEALMIMLQEAAAKDKDALSATGK
jgi:hypothetical protein